MRKLEQIHRQALLKATGCLHTTPTAALQIITKVIPLRLRLQELLAIEYIQFLRKDDSHPLRAVVMCNYDTILPSSNPQVILPSQLMHCAITRYTSKRIDVSNVDKDPKYDPSILCCCSISRKTILAQNLGNANSRSKAQGDKAKFLANKYINEINTNCVICFADSSAQGNSGPCGAGATIYIDSVSSTPILLK